jgi:pimeloyl-ACP methyl ester carboxylesterase
VSLPVPTNGHVEVNCATLFYQVAGSGRPVVLLHAGIADARMWDDQMAAFTPELTVVRYDLRGFGRSSLPPAPFAHHDDLAGLLRTLALPRVVLVAASMGGEVATAFALEHPDTVEALILVDTLAGNASPSADLHAGWAMVDAALEAGDLASAVELELQQWVDGPARAAGVVDPTVRERVRQMDAALLDRLAEHEQASERGLEPPAATRLAEIQAPTLVIVGELDQPDAHCSADALIAGIAGARKVVIPGAAHLPSMEQPAEFNRIVLDFIRGR